MAKNRGSFNAAAGLFNNNTQQVHDVQKEHEAHNVQEVLESTRGRKGHKLPRINMAFTPDNHEYIKKASRRAGISITEYVNILIDKDRKINGI